MIGMIGKTVNQTDPVFSSVVTFPSFLVIAIFPSLPNLFGCCLWKYLPLLCMLNNVKSELCGDDL